MYEFDEWWNRGVKMTVGDLKYIIEQFEEDDDIYEDTEIMLRVDDNWYESMDVMIANHNGSADQFIIEARTTCA